VIKSVRAWIPGLICASVLIMGSAAQSVEPQGSSFATTTGSETKVQNLVGSLSGKLNDQEKMREQAYATGVRSEVLRFQTQLQKYIVSGRKLPFDLGQVTKIQQLVVAGRNAEAKALMQTLEQKLR